ncbi:MFS transporter [Nocardia gamkensis]|uniref:MFS transporter n=1 Tax=Nocardia gamkensis TaxID=352869 RepID=UPI0037CA3A5E
MSATPQRGHRTGAAPATVLMLLTIFGPISMDLYLPVLPALTTELGAATSTAQLTITACLLGLASGQIAAGPLSDRFGRRTPLLVGIVAYIATSLLCAISPSIEFFIAARFVQGLAGAVGIVITQAAGRDIFTGPALIRYYGRLTVLGGLAAIIGPVVGGQLARVTDWRGLFLFLAAIGVVLLAAVLVGLGGAGTVLPLGIVTVTAITLAVIAHRTLLTTENQHALPEPETQLTPVA